jgi:hypothetical protein
MRGFLEGRSGESVISIGVDALFLIKGDLKGLKTMAVLVYFLSW